MKFNLLLIFALLLSLALPTMDVAYAQELEGEEYIVQQGDSLSRIAGRVYDDPSAYPAIVEATNAKAAEDNSSFVAIADPNLIEVGQKLWIPVSPGQSPVPYDAAEGARVMEEAGFAGIYKGFLPSASSPGRDLTLFLGPEDQVTLKTDYLNGEPSIVEVGTWGAGDDVSLILTITGREDADYEAPNVISFEVVDGVLTTSPDEDAYGDAGLQLYRFEVLAMASTTEVMPEPAPTAAVSGTVTSLEPIALPPNAVVEVKLVDVSRQDVAATVLGEQVITNPGQLPVPFEIAYDPASIDPRFTYAVQARITADGQLIFISDTFTPVITRDAPTSDVEIVVVPVGS